jgi:hypothetical protein
MADAGCRLPRMRRRILLRAGFRRIGIGLVTGSFAGHGRATVVTADFAGS